ncbi:MAG: GDP-mannose 4,6-dehydratase [Actinomycetota bacterium]|jgi:GDPmannose 4,6-dehydratase|nr:GDP-mannose 4,6-dehydratase [Actinomycetota bacterium]
MKRALITGITGQDGSYLAEMLLDRGYEVHGIIRRSSSFNTGRIGHIFQDPHDPDVKLHLHYGDLASSSQLARLITAVEPDEVYNLGAQSHVRVSFDIPEYTGDIVALGAVRLLEAIRESKVECRFYQASSSEMFGESEAPQSEETPFRPQSPYAIAKLYAHWATVNYRESYGMHASTGILFNHESPRRGETFVTRKIAMAIPRMLTGAQEHLYLGNLEARRDWGHARDFMEAVHLIARHDVPDDFVIGTGEDHSVQEFVDEAFGLVNLDPDRFVRIDPRYFRPVEVHRLRADATKAREVLGWEPRVRFKELVREMVSAEMEAAGLSLETGSAG